MALVLEISKFFGRDINVVVAYDIFKKICMKNERKDYNGQIIKGYKNNHMRNMFIVAMQNLKYMGYFSASRNSAFSFKKNYFGKPELAQELLSQQQKQVQTVEEKENMAIEKIMSQNQTNMKPNTKTVKKVVK